MKTIKILLLWCGLIYFKAACSQASFCGSEVNVTRALQIQPALMSSNRNYDGERPMIRLALHRVTRTNVTGGFTWNEIDQWVSTLPSAYADANICFTVVQKSTISNDAYFALTSFLGNPTWEDLIATDVNTSAINIYFVEEANKGGIATGFLLNDPVAYPTVTVARELNGINVFNTLVLAHEIGHCLGLLHTHEPAICVENIARTGMNANCTTCGDLLCDTEADHNLGISNSNVNDNTCAYTGNITQNCVPYTPDTRNIMSYTLPTCMLHFSNGQVNRMRNFILATTNMDNYRIPFNRTISGIGNSSWISLYFGVENNLFGADIGSPLELGSGSYTFEAGNQITLASGFTALSGTHFVGRIGSYSCLTPLTTNSAKTDERTLLSTPQSTGVGSDSYLLYPNPNNGTFTIEYSFNETSDIKILIFDLLGNTVALLKDELSAPAGSYSNSYSLKTLSEGMYYVTMIRNGSSTTIPVSVNK